MTGPDAAPSWVVVVTYGRSGSTLVQGLLNAMPGVLVRGEHQFLLLPLFRVHQRLVTVRARYSPASVELGPRAAWYGADALDPKGYCDDVSALLRRQLLGPEPSASVTHLGFKEIRWHEVPLPQHEAFATFLDSVMPEARYLLHRRAHEAVRTSSFWRELSDDEAGERLARIEQFQDLLRARAPERTLGTSYERLVDSRTADDELAALARFVLGSAEPALVESLRTVLSVGHGPVPFTGSGRPPQGSPRVP